MRVMAVIIRLFLLNTYSKRNAKKPQKGRKNRMDER